MRAVALSLYLTRLFGKTCLHHAEDIPRSLTKYGNALSVFTVTVRV
jgi:hypothetical protein